MEEVLEMGGDAVSTTMRMYLMPLNWSVKNVQRINFMFSIFLPQLKNSEFKKETVTITSAGIKIILS